VRELRTAGKTLVTTLLDANKTSKADLKQLYWSRWNVEAKGDVWFGTHAEVASWVSKESATD
jgi:hypothetical protein